MIKNNIDIHLSLGFKLVSLFLCNNRKQIDVKFLIVPANKQVLLKMDFLKYT